MNDAITKKMMCIYYLLAGMLLLLAGNIPNALAENSTEPNLLIYISPREYSHEVRIGYLPYFSAWVRRGPMVEKAAKEALKPQFGELAMCEGSNTGNLIIWLKPYLSYNPAEGYYAKVVAQFHLGNGKHLGNLKATGRHYGPMGSGQIEEQVQQAYDNAMQDIARQYAGDTRLRETIHSGLAKDITKAPCAIVAMVPKS